MEKTIKIFALLCLIVIKFNYKCSGQQKDQNARGEIRLKVCYPESLPDDSLILDVSTESDQVLLDHNRHDWKHYKSSRDKNGNFNFEFEGSDSRSPGDNYTCVFLAKIDERTNLNTGAENGDVHTEMLPCYFFKNGDDVTINVRELGKVDKSRGYRHNFGYQFSGKGALFQKLWFKADSIAYHVTSGAFVDEKNAFNKSNYENTLALTLEAWLTQYKNQLEPNDYYKLLSHGFFNALSDEAVLTRHFLKDQFLKFDLISRNQFLAAYDNSFREFEIKIPTSILEKSPEYAIALFYKAELDASLLNPQKHQDSLYTAIKTKTNGNIRDLLLAYYFVNLQFEVPNINIQAEDALKIVKNSDYQNIILGIQKLGPGNAAFNFDLSDVNGRRVRLSDFKGKVVFMDFWYTGCGNCLLYFQNDLSKIEKQFAADSNVVFITVSIDKLKPSWLKTIQSGKYTSKQAINLFTDGQGEQSDIIKYYHVISFPQPILIGKDQKIKIADDSLRSAIVLNAAIVKQEKD